MFFSIVMPAFKAQATIVESVQSALNQSYGRFELIISADDNIDYKAFLAQNNIVDDRVKFTRTDEEATGSSNARNVGMAMAQSQYIVVLDADDLLHFEKLDVLSRYLPDHPMVTTGLQVMTQDGDALFLIACEGENRRLPAAGYKFTNISMDSMLAFDRKRVPVSYDVELPCLVDLGLMLDGFCFSPYAFHIPKPLHFYRKQTGSISNSENSTSRYRRIKQLLLTRLANGHYPLLGGEEAIDGMRRFLDISLEAERCFNPVGAENQPYYFEDHLRRYIENAL